MKHNVVFKDREKWQKNAYNEMRKEAGIEAGSLSFDQAEGNRLVIVYGESQVGKTTLILSMLGIKEEDFEKVSTTLRGGEQQGNSATATAMLYEKSKEDQYGFREVRFNETFNSQIKYVDEENAEKELGSIRSQMEEGDQASDVVIHVMIPAKYFEPDNSDDKIAIMDMPGIESKNKKEEKHVMALVERYVPLADVCIIVCLGHKIQSLEKRTLVNVGMDWKKMPHKYMIVLTQAFSSDGCKIYFRKPRQDRKDESFEHYIKNKFENEVKNGTILSKDSKMEIYLFDGGKSFRKLRKDPTMEENDKEEIYKIRQSILNDIRKSIMRRQGNRFKGAIEELKGDITRFQRGKEYELNNKRDAKEKEMESLNKKLHNYEEYISRCEDWIVNKKDKQKKNKIEIDSIKNNLDQLHLKCILEVFWEEMQEHEIIKQKKVGRYIILNKEEFYEQCRRYVLGTYFGTENIFLKQPVVNELDRIKEISKSFAYNDEKKNYQNIISNIQDNLNYSIGQCIKEKGYFQKKLYINKGRLEEEWNEWKPRYENKLHKYKDNIKLELDKYIKQERKKLYNINMKKEEWECKHEVTEKRIVEEEKNIKDIQESIDSIKMKRKEAKKIVDGYMKFAHKAYEDQRREMIKDLNNSNTSREEKLQKLLFIGVLDRDYNTIMGGIDI